MRRPDGKIFGSRSGREVARSRTIVLQFICDSTGNQLCLLYNSFFSCTFFRDQHMGFDDLNRPPSGLSFFPTLSFAHSLPPLGEWCREVVRSRQWDRDIMVKENRNKSARRRLSRIPEVWVLTSTTLKIISIPINYGKKKVLVAFILG